MLTQRFLSSPAAILPVLPAMAFAQACGVSALRPIVSLRDFGRRAPGGWRALCDTVLPATARAGEDAPPAVSDDPAPLPGGLYLVATPIGNMEDISMRAVRVLRQADKVLCEDTRRTAQLLNHLGIKANCESFHAHNEHTKGARIIQMLEQGAAIAVVSDAGMPGINDPGSELVAAAALKDMPVIPIPGPSAVLTALVASGLPTKTFMFCGFAQAKSSERIKQFEEVQGLTATLVFFVSPHALVATLADAGAALGKERRCCLARELTKLHEELYRGTIEEALQEFTLRAPRGEFTMVIEGAPEGGKPERTDEEIRAVLQKYVDGGAAPSVAAKAAAAELQVARRRAYALSLQLSAGGAGGTAPS